MIKIKAKIKTTDIRKTSFYSGYRPMFKFIDKTYTTGQIILLNDLQEFPPNYEDIVEIHLLFIEFLGIDFGVGKKFKFNEGNNIIGYGEVIEILNNK